MIEPRIDRNELRDLFALIGRNIAGGPTDPRADETARPKAPAPPAATAATSPAPSMPFLDEVPEGIGRADDVASPAFTLAGLRRPVAPTSLDLVFGNDPLRAATAASQAPGSSGSPSAAPAGDDPALSPAFAGRLASPPDRTATAPSPSASTAREAADVGRDPGSRPATAREGDGVLAIRIGALRDGAAPAAAIPAGLAEAGASDRGPAPQRVGFADPADTGEAAGSTGRAAGAAWGDTTNADTGRLSAEIDGFLRRAGLGEAPAGQSQAERAGVIASFVLNAAMIPGWPPPRPIEAAGFARQVPVPLAMPALSSDEMESGLLLARMLRDPAKVAALLAALATQRRRRKVLALLALLATQVRSLLELWAAELGAIPRAEADAPRRERLVLR